jgi:hypothetical protein
MCSISPFFIMCFELAPTWFSSIVPPFKEFKGNTTCSITNLEPDIQFGTLGAYAPVSETDILKMSKIRNKNFTHTSRHYMCAHQVSQKTNIFYGLCKKDKGNVT